MAAGRVNSRSRRQAISRRRSTDNAGLNDAAIGFAQDFFYAMHRPRRNRVALDENRFPLGLAQRNAKALSHSTSYTRRHDRKQEVGCANQRLVIINHLQSCVSSAPRALLTA